MPKCKSFLKIDLQTKICRLKILSHTQKNFEKSKKSKVEILREAVNRQTYGQTIHALDDPCVKYDTVSQGV